MHRIVLHVLLRSEISGRDLIDAIIANLIDSIAVVLIESMSSARIDSMEFLTIASMREKRVFNLRTEKAYFSANGNAPRPGGGPKRSFRE